MFRRLLALSLTALAAVATAGQVRAQTANTVPSGTSQIQEDWTAVIATGSPATDGPQIKTYMSPVGDSSLPYAWFMLNVRDNPYSAGGMQVQIWDYTDKLLGSATNSSSTAKLNTANETITWTQQLSVNTQYPYSLVYTVTTGASTTWGNFGPTAGLTAITYATGQVQWNALNTYDPAVSVAKSRADWQPNNVTKLGITQVRYLDKNGKTIGTDSTWRPVDLTIR